MLEESILSHYVMHLVKMINGCVRRNLIDQILLIINDDSISCFILCTFSAMLSSNKSNISQYACAMRQNSIPITPNYRGQVWSPIKLKSKPIQPKYI